MADHIEIGTRICRGCGNVAAKVRNLDGSTNWVCVCGWNKQDDDRDAEDYYYWQELEYGNRLFA